jgi:protein ImuA
MFPVPTPSTDRFPQVPQPLEEACAVTPRDVAATVAFALSRRAEGDVRPVLITAPKAWFSEHGRLYGPGAPGLSFLLAPATTQAEALWVLEQALQSGAVALALGAVDGASLAQTRRLEFAARKGEAIGMILPRSLDGLSAARRRWRIRAAASASDPFDLKAPGPSRLNAELVRGRGERPGAWLLEQDDETHRLHLADRLADLGQVAVAGAGASSGLAA